MLFDLQSRRRRSAVKVIYLGLALLMGGGLILFGIGTGGTGGLFDAFSNGGSDTSSLVNSAEKRADRAVRLRPSDPTAWADLVRARYATAGQGDNYDESTQTFTEGGREKLQSAAAAWDRYLALEPDRPDPALARMMANAFSETGLDQPARATDAFEIVTEQQPSASAYSGLAQYAYLANQMRKGDLAAAKAVELAPAAQRDLVRRNLAELKRQVIQQQVQGAAQQQGSSSVSPTG